jgi:2-succinyl-5-enolpyruvyl-6-hydroxy-3-cyclohexene-1-carboxylate synthase
MSPANLLGEWARLLIGSLARAGVQNAVLSPGSRSTPFAWAALHEPRLSCRVLIDERSAGFFALGQAKLTGRPSLLISTSGSAGAHYLPALVEACESRTPVIVLTADRPFELQGCAAPQTIDQTRLFGHHARKFVELGLPDADEAALRALARAASQAVHAARFPEPGPVHLNARAKKPLEPRAPDDAAGRDLESLVASLLEQRPTSVTLSTAAPGSLEWLARTCRAAKRGILVCGELPAWRADRSGAIAALAGELEFAVLCEAPSQLRLALPAPRLAAQVCDAFDLLFRCDALAGRVEPDLILQLGPPPTSGAFERWLAAHPRIERHVIAEHGWPDPQSSAKTLTVADVPSAAALLAGALRDMSSSSEARESRRAFGATLSRLNGYAWQAVEKEIGAGTTLSEGGATRLVVDALPAGAVLAIGNSLPIRHVDLFCRARAGSVRVLAQRGANGIDGLISSAAGAASASRSPTTLLLGDVAFLHDLGGLHALRGLELPFVIVVLNNDGGRIFEQLPLAKLAGPGDAALDAWLTPHGLELGPAAALYGHAYARVTRPDELRGALAEAHARRGCTLIEVIVPPHGATAELGRIVDGFRAALASGAQP